MATETSIGIQMTCPMCGEEKANISLQMWCGDFHCEECDQDFTRDHVERIIRDWPKMLKWVDSMPSSDE